MTTMRTGDGRTFEHGQDIVDVTSLHRPDTQWSLVDKQGHKHEWYDDGKRANQYNPSAHYDTPSLIWVKDGEEYYEGDNEPHDVGHYECQKCGEPVERGYTADTFKQYIAVMQWYRINGEWVSPEEFQREYAKASGGSK